MTTITGVGERVIRAAAAWLVYAERHWHHHPDREDSGYFGTGTVAIQSLEAVAEHAFVCASLARLMADVAPSGLNRGQLIERALAGLRYLAETHVTGSLDCVSGSMGAVGSGGEPLARRDHTPRRVGGRGPGRWGADGWTPVPAFLLWLVGEELGDMLPVAEADMMRRVLEHEANANLADRRSTVLEHHGYFREVPPIPTGRFGHSWPESNAWRGALLAAAQLALPDHSNASRWDDSMKRHFVNALSVPQDAESDEMVDGLPVRERFAGANVHPRFALEHHGFFHPCYAARTMQFLVLAAAAFERHGRVAPQSAAHHLVDEWRMLRRLILWEGRIAYPAGKDHHRYGWGLTYLLPVAAWLHRRHGDTPAALLEEQLTTLFLAEQAHNGDGSFARERMGALLEPRAGPGRRAGERSRVLYYRAEADPPFYLLLAHALHEAADAAGRPRVRVVTEEAERAICGTFEEPDVGLVLDRSTERFASWSWNAHPDVAQGLFVPRGGDHLAEWNGNLAPSFVVLDAQHGPGSRAVAWRATATLDNGFATLGVVRHAGGAIEQHVVYVALPDGKSAVYADDVRARWDLTLLYQEGLRLNAGNDLFNGYRRKVRFATGTTMLVAGEEVPASLRENSSVWLTIDDLLGVQFLDSSGEPWTLRTSPERNATDLSAWYAVLCRPLRRKSHAGAEGAVLQQTCVRLVARPEVDSWLIAAAPVWGDGPEPSLRLDVTGLDGAAYRIESDWAARAVTVQKQGH